jgi:hypothetical protein
MNQILSGNNLTYHGKVELYLILKNGKEMKFATCNEGLAGIADLFTRACLGYPTELYRPYFVDITTESGESNLLEPVELRASTYGVIKSSEVVNSSDNYIVGWKYPIFDALVTTENIVEIGSGVHYIYLLNKNKGKLARVKINVDQDSLETSNGTIPTLGLREGNNILIKWYMYLSNRTEEDNG